MPTIVCTLFMSLESLFLNPLFQEELKKKELAKREEIEIKKEMAKIRKEMEEDRKKQQELKLRYGVHIYCRMPGGWSLQQKPH